jgi:hypothetical protein
MGLLPEFIIATRLLFLRSFEGSQEEVEGDRMFTSYCGLIFRISNRFDNVVAHWKLHAVDRAFPIPPVRNTVKWRCSFSGRGVCNTLCDCSQQIRLKVTFCVSWVDHARASA